MDILIPYLKKHINRLVVKLEAKQSINNINPRRKLLQRFITTFNNNSEDVKK